MNFYDWLQEHVTWRGYSTTRGRAIHRFVAALYPWLESLGFRWSCGQIELANTIANGLFDNRGKAHIESNWPGAEGPEGAFQEIEDHYRATVDWGAWESFWESWGLWGDVHPEEFRGQDRRLDIQEFVWGQVDLENSPQTDVVIELLGGSLEEDEDGWPGGRQDAYLLDAESNGWGGYRR